MQKIKYDLSRFKKEENKKVCATEWQDYALTICNEFNISPVYRQLIFRQAKKNISFLQGKVTLCKEKFSNVSDKGKYLISLFRNKTPWEK